MTEKPVTVPVAVCTPVVQAGVGEPKYAEPNYPPQPNYIQGNGNVAPPDMSYGQQHFVQQPPVAQNMGYMGSSQELLSSNSCQCQTKKKYEGVFRFPSTGTLRLHCCSCQGQTTIDAREMVFPPSNNAIIETSGWQQTLRVYHLADTSVSSNLGGCQSAIRSYDKRPKESKSVTQPFFGRHITVQQSQSCCMFQSSVVTIKLDPHQEPPADCVIS